MIDMFTPGPATVSITATSSSDRIALPSTGGTVRVLVPLGVEELIFIRAGDDTVVATDADMPIIPGSEPFDFGAATHVAVIKPDGSAVTIYLTTGRGN